MQPILDAQTARDRLLRCIGRNVVNFQYLEESLRRMIPALSYKSEVLKPPVHHAERSRIYKKSSLGDLAKAFHTQILGRGIEEVSGALDEAPPEPKFSFSVEMEVSPEAAIEQKRALIKLVTERNRLIHKDILSVDLNSPEQCEAFSIRLDEQNSRILQQLAELNSIRDGVREAAKELQSFIESEEFLAMLRGEQSST